ncbi:uncharacterized protein TNCV_2068221 [Trichonephila clavipes]|uniref:Uncharacterized protein n=1 Tax=Trichonephila clavipes TaxID=2585209 RepID=A0A8X6W3I1_TRICX|nr:uncharacterized protein TNCV_2068221 [Trichonephila clavipes]
MTSRKLSSFFQSITFKDLPSSSSASSYDYLMHLSDLPLPSERRAIHLISYYTVVVGVPLRHGGTLNSRRAASPLVWLVEGKERWEAPDLPQGFLPLNWGGTEQKRTVTFMVLRLTTGVNSSP